LGLKTSGIVGQGHLSHDRTSTHERRVDAAVRTLKESKAMSITYQVVAIGTVRSPLTDRAQAPKQGREGAPNAWLELEPAYREAARDLEVGEEVLILTWFHRADRLVLQTHPRDDESIPLTGIFSTRSPDRPNPIGIHRVRILQIVDGLRLHVSALEAIDGTPIVDLKPVLDESEG
jgi:tRNA-Thr(GGU) m(6)t(6)A37 methyltransferase TsaA